MKLIKSLVLGAALTLATATASSAITVMVDGKNGSQTVALGAGTYTVNLSQNAWSAWSTGNRWLNNYFVDPANSRRVRVNDGTRYTSVAAAVAASQAYTFTLAAAQNVGFYILDFGNVNDNRGKLTLDIQGGLAAVPVPASGALLLAGLVAPFVMRRRKKA